MYVQAGEGRKCRMRSACPHGRGHCMCHCVSMLAAGWLQAGAMHYLSKLSHWETRQAEWEEWVWVPIVAVLMLLSEVKRKNRALGRFPDLSLTFTFWPPHPFCCKLPSQHRGDEHVLLWHLTSSACCKQDKREYLYSQPPPPRQGSPHSCSWPQISVLGNYYWPESFT